MTNITDIIDRSAMAKTNLKKGTPKGFLTFDEKIRIAHAYFVHGVDQHILASIFAVNPGRVGEVVSSIKKALDE